MRLLLIPLIHSVPAVRVPWDRFRPVNDGRPKEDYLTVKYFSGTSTLVDSI